MRISPWKDLGTFMKFFNFSNLPTKNIETFVSKEKMEETFSLSQDMAEDVGSYLNGGKSLGEQDSLVETWTVIVESGLVQLLINAYKRESKHHSKG